MSVIIDLIDENSSCHARIAKRDARIVELESAAESLRISRDYHHEQENEYRRRWAGLCTAPVSEAKAQGVVMQATDGGRNPRYEGLFDGETEEHRAFRLNAAPVQQPKCKTCNDNGRIGGPSFYAPDEGGDPCPDCCAPVQQVSVPTHEMIMAGEDQWERSGNESPDVAAIFLAMLAAAPAAPAAPAADGWIPVSERLPGEDDQVLCWCEDETVAWAEVSSHHNSFFTDMTHELLPVTHWMPLPSAPSANSAKGVV